MSGWIQQRGNTAPIESKAGLGSSAAALRVGEPAAWSHDPAEDGVCDVLCVRRVVAIDTGL